MTDISNSADTIDSRDIIARIDELEAYEQAIKDAQEELQDYEEQLQCYQEDEQDIEDREQEVADARAALKEAEDDFDIEDRDELETLRRFAEEASGYCPDWHHGATLIRDSYFKEYAEQLAEDVGAIDASANWPLNCIDWDKAAEELQYDYTMIDYNGVNYWIR